VGAEGIDIFSGREVSKPTPKIPHNALETPRGGTFPFPDWKSLWTPWQQPQPPRLPPTTTEFMNQCQIENIGRTMTNGEKEDIDDEECTREWFGRTRATTNPFSTSAASRTRTTPAAPPLSGNVKTTSILGWIIDMPRGRWMPKKVRCLVVQCSAMKSSSISKAAQETTRSNLSSGPLLQYYSRIVWRVGPSVKLGTRRWIDVAILTQF